jgi:hypothetical protein
MPVIASEIKWYKSASVNNTGSNGGRMSNSESTSEVKNNIFPDASQAERTAGSILYRKMFVKNTNAANLAAQNPKFFEENYTAGQDAISFFPGTQTDLQSDITGAERRYGCGQLAVDASATDTVIEVTLEDENAEVYQDGDTIRISDKTDIDDGAGNEEYATISGAPVYDAYGGVTITLAAGLANDYLAAGTRVDSVYEPADIETVIGAAAVTSAAGTFDDTTYPILGDNKGTIEQNWTLTFTSGSAFTVAGDTIGSVGAGAIGADFAPNNPATGTPYFTIDHLAFGGTFIAGDTIIFAASPASVPLWYRRDIPAGSSAQTNDRVIVALDYESA